MTNIISYLGIEEGLQRKDPARSMILSDQYQEIEGQQFYEAALAFGDKLHTEGLWNQPVMIRAEHRLETLAMFLGTLLSGNYYVPVPDDCPGEMQHKIAGCLYTEQIYTAEEINFSQRAAVSEEKKAALKVCREKLPKNAALYIIFTSGSTGEPKGIVKSHECMISFLKSYTQEFSFSEDDVMANQTPFCFDASAKDFYLMLLDRMDFHILDHSMFFRPLEIVHLLEQRKVTLLQWVPSALSMFSRLKAFEKETPSYLNKIFFVGETLPVKELSYWQTHFPKAQFVNLYGASETAGVCCCFKMSAQWQGKEIPIGRALCGQKVFLAKEEKVVTEADEVGEIVIEGDILAEGYLQQEKQDMPSEPMKAGASTEASRGTGNSRFVTQQTEEGQCVKRYYTGDLAKYDAEGNLCFVSRSDFQIKHMGHRIELGEIESMAEQTAGVERAGAVYKKGKIYLFYQGQAEKAVLQKSLKENLQSYKLPQKIIPMVRLPVNRNGKLDRMALRDMDT